MNAMFDNFSLDLIALESAITLFEVENDITPDYLASDYSRDEAAGFAIPANESATDNDDFLATLFTDTQSPVVSAATEAAGESVGSKIGKAISGIIGAVKNMFSTLLTKFREKRAKVKGTLDSAKGQQLTPAEKDICDEARDVTASVAKVFNILNTSVTTDCKAIENICQKVSAAIKAAQNAGHDFSSGSSIQTNKEKRDGAEKNVAAARSYEENFSGSFEGKDMSAKRNAADKELQHVRIQLDNMKKVDEALEAAVAEITEQYNKLIDRLRAKEGKSLQYNAEGGKFASFKKAEHAKSEEDKQSEEDKKAEEDWQKARENDRLVSGGGKKDSLNDKLTLSQKVARILAKAHFVEKGDVINRALSSVEAVEKACQSNVKECDVIMNAVKGSNMTDNQPAKIAYESCKIYKESSVVFQRMARNLNECISLGFFNSQTKRKVFTAGQNRNDIEKLHD